MPMARSTVGMMSTEWISACRSVEVVPAPAKTIGICWARRWMPPWSPATEEQEIEALDRGLEALAGVRPTGYRAPMWDLSWRTPALLAELGFLFDSSLMDADTPYELAVGEGSLVESPIQWALDDWEQYCFLPDISGSGLIETPAKAVELWRAESRALRAAGGCRVLTNHPFLSGRPSRAAALSTLMAEVVACEDVWVASLGEMATHVRGLDLPPRSVVRPEL